ncbi:unnamed protein product [Fraxinus pennsylvanica]|uniref:3-isopropylmalate dehydratase n=1 Tax=Fraxinus pennsylvanica TaxID=56036 RepID=A0AAD2DXP6_9LAMI|nr:unnamed protein product [Fraxinus pennsylvanica]
MAAASAAAVSEPYSFKLASHRPNSPSLTAFSSLKLPCTANSPNYHFKSLKSQVTPQSHHRIVTPLRSTTTTPADVSTVTTFHGLCYVVGDNIDTDQIIPAEYLTLVPSNPDEYEKLGSYALIGLPSSYETRFIDPGETKSKYSIVIGGDNFGCGSSREHAPVALGASGVVAVVAESYARIFFRNSVATGEVYPLESEGRLCEECKTGDVVTIELGESKLINHTSGKEYKLKPIGDAGPIFQGFFLGGYVCRLVRISIHLPDVQGNKHHVMLGIMYFYELLYSGLFYVADIEYLWFWLHLGFLVDLDPYLLNPSNWVEFVDTPIQIAASRGLTNFAIEIMSLKPSLARKLNSEGFSALDLALHNGYANMTYWIRWMNKASSRNRPKECSFFFRKQLRLSF